MQSELLFPISVDTTDTAAVDLALDLAADIGRVTIPFSRRVILPAAKNGRRKFDECSASID